MTASPREVQFGNILRGLRDAYQKKRDSTNCYPPFQRPLVDLDAKKVNGTYEYSWWYEDEKSNIRYLRIHDVPGSLSGNILRLRDNVPPVSGDCEIYGNEIRPVENASPPPVEPSDYDDFEDVSAEIVQLPLVSTINDTHFLKKPKYKSEIDNLLACQGGSCPGTPLCPNIIQLLGKTPDGRLVFPKYTTRPKIVGQVYPLETYKSWLVQILHGLKVLHGLGIVHRDLRIDNLVWSHDARTVLICDLESRWGNRQAPEVLRNSSLDAGWSPASDIWDLGNVIKGLLYGNAPINNFVEEEWEVPSPFADIVEACQRTDLMERASVEELLRMAGAIES